MPFDSLKYFFERTAVQNPAFLYRGEFDDYFTGIILDMASTRTRNSSGGSFDRKVSSMLVECFQNLIRHADSIEGNSQSTMQDGMFCFKNLEQGFIINSINLIKDADKENLTNKVQHINSMTEEALKNFYLNSLGNGEMSDKGGAGLGLIDLARKSGQKILVKTESLGNGYTNFHQQITLLFDKDKEKYDFTKEIDENHEMYTKMIEHGLRLVFKGDVSNKSLLTLLDFLHAYVGKTAKISKHLTYAAHVFIELSQNITKYASRYGSGNSGLLMLGERGDHTVIYSGNIVDLSDKILLEEKLAYLSLLEKEELNDLHKRIMRASLRFEDKYRTGLGLIEVVKAGSEPFSYCFHPLADEMYLFGIAVVI